jgi:hypothetical protein
MSTQIRPGIQNATLAKLKIVHVGPIEAYKRTGTEHSGLIIPYPDITVMGKEYCRLRYDNPPDPEKKYHQPWLSGIHNYIQPGLTLKDGALILVEGEFKAISLTEAGFPAVGTSGFYSWRKKIILKEGQPLEDNDETDLINKPKLDPKINGIQWDKDGEVILLTDKKDGTPVIHREIQALIDRLKPSRIVYVGDPDTSLNGAFGSAMTSLADLAPCPVYLTRIPYDAPNGKGVDDIRQTIGASEFKGWFQGLLDGATLLEKETKPEELSLTLLERERELFSSLTGEKRTKAIDQLIKLHIYVGEKKTPEKNELRKAIKKALVEIFKLTDYEFDKLVDEIKARQELKRQEEEKRNKKRYYKVNPDEVKEAPANNGAPASPPETKGDGKTVPLPVAPTTTASPPVATNTPPRETASEQASSAAENEHPEGERKPQPFGDLQEEIDAARQRDADLPPPAPPSLPLVIPYAREEVLNKFVMIGEDFYTYSYVKVGSDYRQSAVMTRCSKAFVESSLRAAGYSRKNPSTELTPVVGRVPFLTELQAAFFYLGATRCASTTNLLFRPYGPTLQPDGTRVFNTSQVKPMAPWGFARRIDDPKIAPIMGWLAFFFSKTEAFEHFLSLLSFAYKAARAGKPQKTRAVFFLGPPNSGKSLLIDKIIPMIFGQEAAGDAHRLIRGEIGATSILSHYVCKLSDKEIGGPGDIQRMQQGLLSLLADHTMGGRALYEDVKTIEVFNLFMFSSNPDGSVVRLLEGMPMSILEKFAIYEGDLNIEQIKKINEVTRGGEPDLIAKIIECLPYFCGFLEKWDGSRFYDERFGVRKFVPERFSRAVVMSPNEELVYCVLKDVEKLKFQSAPDIYAQLVSLPSRATMLKGVTASQMVKILTRLEQIEPDLVKCMPYGKSKTFMVDGPGYREKHPDSKQDETGNHEPDINQAEQNSQADRTVPPVTVAASEPAPIKAEPPPIIVSTSQPADVPSRPDSKSTG